MSVPAGYKFMKCPFQGHYSCYCGFDKKFRWLNPKYVDYDNYDPDGVTDWEIN